MTSITTIQIPTELQQIADALNQQGVHCYLVGGFLRDQLIGYHSKDIDVEVFNIASLAALGEVLQAFGSVHQVGQAFEVLKLTTEAYAYDFSLPALGQSEATIATDTPVKLAQAAKRRDFTINSLSYDISNGVLVDPFNGLADIQAERLQHTSEHFKDDPLRVYRAMQFSARFGFTIEPETVLLARSLDLSALPKERLFEEWRKLLLKSPAPSIGLQAAKQMGVLDYHPELKALANIPQDPTWHPEGSVWVHTLMVVDEAAKLRNGDEQHDLALMFGALCHDLGKATHTQMIDERWRARGHEEAGEEPTRSFLGRLTNQADLIEQVVSLVRYHLAPATYMQNKAGSKAIRKLALKVDIPLLCELSTADKFGRLGDMHKTKAYPARDWLLQRASELGVKDEKPTPILKGRELVKLGIKPGPEIGKIIEQSFEAQLEGTISNEEEAVAWAGAYVRQLTNEV